MSADFTLKFQASRDYDAFEKTMQIGPAAAAKSSSQAANKPDEGTGSSKK